MGVLEYQRIFMLKKCFRNSCHKTLVLLHQYIYPFVFQYRQDSSSNLAGSRHSRDRGRGKVRLNALYLQKKYAVSKYKLKRLVAMCRLAKRFFFEGMSHTLILWAPDMKGRSTLPLPIFIIYILRFYMAYPKTDVNSLFEAYLVKSALRRQTMK